MLIFPRFELVMIHEIDFGTENSFSLKNVK